MKAFPYWQSFAMLLLASLVACSQQQSPQELREKTAQETAEMKQDAAAVAQGIREGLTSGSDKRLNLNSASKDQLLSLPGVTPRQANRVIVGRPFNDPRELVIRRVMPQSEYDKIADQVRVGK